MSDFDELNRKALELSEQLVQLLYEEKPDLDPGTCLGWALSIAYSGHVSFHKGIPSTAFAVGICDFLGNMLATAKNIGGDEFETRVGDTIISFIQERPWQPEMDFRNVIPRPRKEAS
jgi:hypothetical protein